MARIINTVGTLSALKEELDQRNITQFHSIKDIKEFERTYEQQLKDVENKVRLILKSKLKSISAKLDGLIPVIRSMQAKAEEEVNERISRVNERIKSLETKKKNALQRFVTHFKVSSLHKKIRLIENNRTHYIKKSFKQKRIEQVHLKKRFNKLNNNFEEIVNINVNKHVRRIKQTKASIDELRPVILGSIGESRVASTLSALPDSYVAINDVYFRLSKPIFYPSENERIFSFQIDHVVVGPGGVFAIETKHWGQESISNRDLFSPVKQVRRSGYALFRVINDAINYGLIDLDDSWGDRAVSVRNIIVFTSSLVKKKYNYVKLLDLASLNGYIQWFDEGLSTADVDKIVSYLTD